MTEEEAHETFKKYLAEVCGECGAAPDVLCKAGGVWIHLSRMTDSWKD